MGVCTSIKKRRKDIVKANTKNQIKNDIKEPKDNNYNKGQINTSRTSNDKKLEKIMGKENKTPLKIFNANQKNAELDNNKNLQILNNSNFSNKTLEDFESMNKENIPIAFIKEKKDSKDEKNIYNKKTEFSEKKSEKDNSNFNNLKSKDDNHTFSTLKIEEMKNDNNNNKDEKSNLDNKINEESNDNKNQFTNNKNDINNENKNNKIKDEKNINNSFNKIHNIKPEENINKNEEKEKNNDNNLKDNNKDHKKDNSTINKRDLNSIKNNNDSKYYEEDTFSNITFINNININTSSINDKKSKNSNENYNNTNYYMLKGNLFNLDKKIDLTETSNTDNQNKNDLYYFSEFHFTKNKNYSLDKDFDNLLNSQIFQNKIVLSNRLLNLQERQWYKESILLSESLKINRMNSYIDSDSFSHYLNKIINLYNHFNWLIWALGYYYCNSLLFNKNHWFNAKNTGLPSYDNLDWLRGFEWKGLYIKVQTYHESKNIIKEIKALNYAFLDYIQIIDNFKYKSNINSLNLLSNELIFPFISYIYFGGIIIYVSAVIKKFCYEENSVLGQSLYNFDIKKEYINSKNNSNTKSNTNSNRNTFDVKEKQFDDISEVPLYYRQKSSQSNTNTNNLNDDKMDNKNFLKFNEDYISLNENVINNDVNISTYSKIDLENSKILCKITENNLIKVVEDISANSNINSDKYKFVLTNIYSLLPNLFNKSEIENNDNSQNISYIKYKNNYDHPRIYQLTKQDIKPDELNTINGLLDVSIEEQNINIYDNNFNGINYRIIYQKNYEERNERITNFFVKMPYIQNRELSNIIINQYLKKKNINFLMYNFQKNHNQEITDNNIVLFKNNINPKMKYSIISRDKENFTIENFHIFIDNICKNITSYKTEMRNVDNLLNFCEKVGLNTIFLPFLIAKINDKNIVNLIKIYLFSNIIKQFFCYNQGQNLLLKLSIYEASKDKDILNSIDNTVRDNNMIELQRLLLVNIIKFFLLPFQYKETNASIDYYNKQNFVTTFMENISFFVFIHALKIKKFEKVLNFSSTFLSKMNVKEIIKEYSLICRSNPFLFIDTLEKLINFRMNPYLKYRASLDAQNLNDLKKEEIIIFAPKINTFVDFSSLAGYIYVKSVVNNNMMSMSLSNNLLLSSSNINVTTKIGKVDSYMINNCNSKCNNNNNNITKKLQDDNDEENITISINMDGISNSGLEKINNNQDFHSKNKFINNNELNNKNDFTNTKEKSQKSFFKSILNKLMIDNFLPPKINKNNFNNKIKNLNISSSKNLINNYYISNEEILIEYNKTIDKILGETISFNGLAEMIIFKSNIYEVLKLIFISKNLKQAKEIIKKMKEKFEKQYLFTFNQCAVFSFLESLTYEKYKDSQDYYCKTLIFALFSLGDVRCNNINGHPFILLPLYILCKITGYLDGSDTNEYFKEMFRCLNFKINKNLKLKEIDSNDKKLIYYCFPSVSDLKLKNNDFLYEKDFIIFLINSLLNFFYSGDSLFIDNDYLSYNKINFKISKSEEDNHLNTSLNDENNKKSDNNNIKIKPSHFIVDILLEKMSYLKYGPSDIIVSFGKNNFNQTTHDGYDMLTLPRLVYKLCDIKIKKIFSGYDYNFIIDKLNHVYSWGDNSCGQCGQGEKKIIKSPKQLFFPELSENEYIDNIICGNNYTYFTSNNKRIFLCGFNFILKKCSYIPTLLDLGFDSDIIQVKSGEDFVLFLTDKGNVYSMGYGSEGQLGIKEILNLNEYEHKKYCSKPTKILNSIMLISCGYKYAFAKSFNGEIFGWGKNDKGQLGLNFCEETKEGEENCNIISPEKLEFNLENIEIKNIICGKNYSFFQTNNNELLGCGNNDKEQLGIQNIINNSQKITKKICNDYIIPTEIEQFSLLKVSKISCGEEHCLAIIKDTISNLINIWGWGSNNYGQLGLGSYINISKPKPNHYLLEFINHKFIDISTGKNHSIILLQRKDYNEFNNDETLIELINKYSKI